MFTMRSNDLFLGCPFNVLSYATLTHIIAKTCGLQTGELTYSCGSAHVYKNHLEQVKLQTTREPYEFPTLNIKKELKSIKDIEELKFEDFEIINYKYHPAIKGVVAI
jgi:thymidylate synthase